MIEDKKIQKAKPQNLILENREKLNITGVIEVGSFNEEVVTMKTELGELTIYGYNLKINKLDVDNSEISIDGNIQCLEYSDKNNGKAKNRNIFSQLFK